MIVTCSRCVWFGAVASLCRARMRRSCVRPAVEPSLGYRMIAFEMWKRYRFMNSFSSQTHTNKGAKTKARTRNWRPIHHNQERASVQTSAQANQQRAQARMHAHKHAMMRARGCCWKCSGQKIACEELHRKRKGNVWLPQLGLLK